MLKTLVAATICIAVVAESSALPTSLLLAQSTAPVKVANLQAALNSYLAQPVATRPPVFNLPNTYVLCDQPLKVPAGVANVTLRGGPNTSFIRTTNVDIPLIQVGSFANYSLANAPLLSRPHYNLMPLGKGASAFQTTNGANVPPGFYVLFGDSPAPLANNDDIVRHPGGSTDLTYWYKREIVFVTGTQGAQSFGAPIGRTYDHPKIAAMTTSTLDVGHAVSQNIAIENIKFDGRPNAALPFRYLSPKTYPKSIAYFGLISGLSIKNVHIKNFQNTGLRINLCKDVEIDTSQVTDSDVNGFRYGIEVTAARGVVIRNCSFSDMRTSIATGSGTMDMNVYDCYSAPDGSGFDLSHGQGEQDISYFNCIADHYQFGNTVWTRGGTNLRLINSSARQFIDLKPNAKEVLIVGKYVDSSQTPPVVWPTAARLQFHTYGSNTSVPAGIFNSPSVAVEDALFEMNSGNELTPIPNTGSVVVFWAGGTATVPKMPELSFRNCVFRNALVASNSSTSVTALGFVPLTPSDQGFIVFENSSFYNTNGYSPVLYWGPTSSGGAYDMRYTDCRFYTVNPGGLAITRALRFTAGSSGNVYIQRCRFNNVTREIPMDGAPGDQSILNEGSVNLTYIP